MNGLERSMNHNFVSLILEAHDKRTSEGFDVQVFDFYTGEFHLTMFPLTFSPATSLLVSHQRETQYTKQKWKSPTYLCVLAQLQMSRSKRIPTTIKALHGGRALPRGRILQSLSSSAPTSLHSYTYLHRPSDNLRCL